MSDSRCQLADLDEGRHCQPAGDSQQQNERDLHERVELQCLDLEQGVPRRQCAVHCRGGDRSEHNRYEADHRVFRYDHFHGENHAGQRRVESGSDPARGAAGDQSPQTVIGQSEALAQQAVDGAPKVYPGPLAPSRLAGGQGKCAAGKLYQGIAQGQGTVVRVHAADDVDYAGFAFIGA